jgi:hypothetical protein
MIEKENPHGIIMFATFAFAKSKGKVGTQARFNKRPANGHDHSACSENQLLQMHLRL